MIKVSIPPHLRTLAQVKGDIQLAVDAKITINNILDKLEETYPMLAGTIRNRQTKKRRDMVRFFACCEDITQNSPDDPLPEAITNGTEPLMIVGAIAGG